MMRLLPSSSWSSSLAPKSVSSRSRKRTGSAKNGALVTDGESAEVTAQTTTVKTTIASYEDIREVTRATEVTDPIQMAWVSTRDTRATDIVVEAEISKSSTSKTSTSPLSQPNPG